MATYRVVGMSSTIPIATPTTIQPDARKGRKDTAWARHRATAVQIAFVEPDDSKIKP